MKPEEFTRLTYTGLIGGLEHIKIETRLIDEKFANTMGEYVTYTDSYTFLKRVFKGLVWQQLSKKVTSHRGLSFLFEK
jgi:hypothetical protein